MVLIWYSRDFPTVRSRMRIVVVVEKTSHVRAMDCWSQRLTRLSETCLSIRVLVTNFNLQSNTNVNIARKAGNRSKLRLPAVFIKD